MIRLPRLRCAVPREIEGVKISCHLSPIKFLDGLNDLLARNSGDFGGDIGQTYLNLLIGFRDNDARAKHLGPLNL